MNRIAKKDQNSRKWLNIYNTQYTWPNANVSTMAGGQNIWKITHGAEEYSQTI